MKTDKLVLSIVCAAPLIFASLASADTATVQTMADITMNLSHFPSDSDKQKLSAIIASGDSSKTERTVATAIMNIEHRVTDADKNMLSSINGDDSAPTELRTLAGVLININHSPSESDAAKLYRGQIVRRRLGTRRWHGRRGSD